MNQEEEEQSMRHTRIVALFAALIALSEVGAVAAPHCYTSYGGVKPNKLYLYFPLVDDASYPEFGTPLGTPPTRPAHAFNIADLTSYTGTVGALRNGVYDVVADDYCEFNVEVIVTTTAPPNTFPRRNTVSIGTDDGTAAGGLFGLAQNIDTGDATLVDFAHEWAATYQGLYGGAGGALNGANSTVDRWARAIGGTAAHEAGHNYGLSHTDGLALAAGEDPLVHHLMASGSHFSGEDRAGFRRHFSDHEYSVLASNVGLSVQTVWNWDFVNPNAQTAVKVRMDILSTQNPLTVSGPYNGNESPWVNPTVSGSLGTQVFQGVPFHRFQVTWSTGHAWDGHVPGGPGPASGTSGQVAGAASFHVGTGFSGVNYNLPNPIIITDVTLFDASNTALALHPRAVAFDSGALDAADGALNVQAINFGAPLQLAALRLQLLPRLLNIDSMVAGNQRLVDVRGIPFSGWGETRALKAGQTLRKGESLKIPIAYLKDKRHIVERVSEQDCASEDRLKGRDVARCRPGINVDLFPATTAFLSATVIDPSAKHWDAEKKAYVEGPVTTHAFLQITGRHPDLNRNGVDDYIDILSGKAKDENHDGIPDPVSKK
jgi:hypothetical protein